MFAQSRNRGNNVAHFVDEVAGVEGAAVRGAGEVAAAGGARLVQVAGVDGSGADEERCVACVGRGPLGVGRRATGSQKNAFIRQAAFALAATAGAARKATATAAATAAAASVCSMENAGGAAVAALAVLKVL